jgi:hypothetical protein
LSGRKAHIQARRHATPHDVTSGENEEGALVPVVPDVTNPVGALSPEDSVLPVGCGGGTVTGASLLTWGAGI